MNAGACFRVPVATCGNENKKNKDDNGHNGDKDNNDDNDDNNDNRIPPAHAVELALPLPSETERPAG